ncbi:MAG: Asp-tRNA(Asn)/Glu-tRNA(Gln) amidotransferase subunit GatC [Chloroflexia bacterium]|nr:Asp-tRNA(Asn)/Glu-tRNA(Gln) amidotransferase subunit GatC [Chloroflexia bacterium]
MHLSLAEVDHVATLARLGLAGDERERLREQLSSILDHISALNQLDTAAIAPTAQVVELTNVMRADEVRPSLPRDALLANAPRQRDGFFEVHAILTGNDDPA